MTFQQLRCFTAVVKYHSYNKAAKHLFLTQPAVSHQIQLLEAELNTSLFDHTQKKTVLTNAGNVFYESATDLLNRANMAVQQVQSSSSDSYLTVVFEYLTQLPRLSEILTRFHQEMPEVIINLTVSNRLDSCTMIMQHLADIAIFPESAFSVEQTLEHTHLGLGKLFCIMHRNHPLAVSEIIKVSDLSGQNLLIPDASHCPPELAALLRQLREKVQNPRFSYANSVEQALAMVEADLGVVILPEFTIPLHANIPKIPLEVKKELPLIAAWHTENSRPSIECFLRITKEVIDKG